MTEDNRIPAPRPGVWFPGDTVPGGAWVVSIWGARFMYASDWPVTITGPLVETSRGVALPPDEWQAAVDRARDARADAEWQHTEGTTP